ncbi:hypothetical protein CKF54_00990 [Psittacicella hinzii]|uniref:Uncharacterized protein n=1 Tax=Psittacicella hinzii TaxID=2028575 RepID=A0A3A1YDS6_9GAMM|nr:BamA/TamA family outer membrane protein [Psittacicella hinzii]RIY34287.1 hypothetical protein CKF54_00990 [Psittacicella hinzii]
MNLRKINYLLTCSLLFPITSAMGAGQSNLLITPLDNGQTHFRVIDSAPKDIKATQAFNAVTALRLYLTTNDIRHIGQTAYPVTYQFVNQVFDALATCQPASAANTQVSNIRGVRNLSYAQVEQAIASSKTGNYEPLYQALNLLGKNLNVPDLNGAIYSDCVIEQLTNSQAIDYQAFKAEQEKAPNVLQQLKAYYDSLFVNYYTPLAQNQQTPPFIFTNKGSNVLVDNPDYEAYTNKSLLSSKASFTVTTGDFNVVVYGLGSQAEQEALANNLYAQVANNVRNAISTITQINADGSLRHLFTVDKLVNNAVQAYGFYNAQVRVEPVKNNDKEFTVNITLGEPVRLTDTSQVIIRGPGSGLEALYDQAQKITPAGTVFKSSDYSSVKNNLLTAAQEAGYLDANYRVSKVLVNREQNIARWYLDLDTGSRYTISSITIEGGPIDHTLAYYMTNLSVGSDYSETDVSRSIAYLQASNNFATVDLASEVNKENRTVDLTYRLTNADRNRIEWSNGYDTTEGFRTSAYYDRYYVNRWGGSVSANAYFSKLTQRLETYYRHPYLYSPLTKYWNLGFYIERAYNSRILEYSRSLVGYFSYVRAPFRNWQFTSTLYMRKDLWNEQNVSRNQNMAYGEFILARSGLSTEVSFTLRTNFGLHKYLSSNDVSYNAYIVRARHTFKLTENNDVVFGVRYGKIDTNNFFQVAPALRFYSGGMNSIRGYGYQSISSYKGSEDLGSNKQLELTAEFLHTIVENLKGAVFVDGGDSSDKVSIKNMKDWYYGAGFGVRYYLPVGYASFDIAYPLEPGFAWSKIAFYININASF